MSLDKRITECIDTVNELYRKTGLLVQAETKIYEINQPKSPNKVLAILKWDDYNAKYYAEYVNEVCN